MDVPDPGRRPDGGPGPARAGRSDETGQVHVTPPQDWVAPDGTPGTPGGPPGQPAGEQPTAAPGPAQQGQDRQPSPPAPAGWQGQPGWGAAPPGVAGAQPGWGPPPGTPQGGWGWPQPPEVKPGVVPLRPLGLGELLDGAVGVVRRYPRPTLGLSAAIALVTTVLNFPLLLSLFGSPLFDPTAFTPGSDTGLDAELGGLFAGLGASSLLSFLAGVVLAGVITAVVGKAVLGQAMSLGQAWSAVRPLLLRLVGLAVVVLLLVWGSFTLAVLATVLLTVLAGPLALIVGIPLVVVGVLTAVHLYVRLALAASVMVLERARLAESLRRSAVLVKGDWWRVFGILLLVMVITSFVSQVLQAPFAARSFLGGVSGEPTELGVLDVVLSSIGSALALTVVAPFGAAVSALLYVDRRMRAEGLDVALTAAAAASRAP
jgi:hypothetical protein